jgi:nicotinamidase/pyrazinamidase
MRNAVIVIDMLHDFIRPEGLLYVPGAERIIPALAARLAEARAAGDAVIYSCNHHLPDDKEFAIYGRHAVLGSPGAEVIDELAPRPGDRIVPKRRYSAFFCTELLLALREFRVEEVEITGVVTNICVYFTAADARNLDYPVTVHAGRVAGLTEREHEWALEQMVSVLGVNVVREPALV